MNDVRLSVVPLAHADYQYVCVFGVGAHVAWASVLPDRGVLIEAENENSVGAQEGVQVTPGWPAVVVQQARATGLEPTFAGVIPLLDRAQIDGRVFWNRLSLGLVESVQTTEATAWARAVQEVRRTLVPIIWAMPRSCRALLAIEEGQFAYLMSRNRSLIEEWIAHLLAATFFGTVPTSACSLVAKWIVASANGTGVRIRTIAWERNHAGHRMIAIHGSWGIDEAVPLSIGQHGGEPFSVTFPAT